MVLKKETTKNEAVLNLTASLRAALEGDGVFQSLVKEVKLLASNKEGIYRLEQVLVDHEGQLKEVVFDGKHYR
ncbi:MULTISPECIES: hypothetical protein [Olivibacter]|jgi:hypothetical protein|uniref:Uncharacterized protein n=2 Tax=Olivibacter TaxID=376469 RepID=A0ABV6HHE6_9SPHI|nr:MULTISPECIES: hypothetical protein [Olivibacter]MDM8176479.1 hypothetical protein [Olivibacter sp. 47]MDX3916067.1 hypothetical protein [Pseudosphingobacterium sp.]QEL00740.1 hypothetical protein FKG96_07930 [Olivibacter sp. LS-1]